MKNTGNAVKQE